MITDIVIFSGVAIGLILLVEALRNQLDRARLKQRLSSVASMNGIARTDEARDLQLIERLFLCAGKDRQEVVLALRGAGYYIPWSVVIFAAVRFFSTFLVAGTSYLVAGSGFNSNRALLWAFVAGAATFLLSKMVLRSSAAAQIRRASKELPFMLDTLMLLLESGISLEQTFRYFAQAQVGGLKTTHRSVVAMVDDLQNGIPYGLALDRWADRLQVPGVRELAALFKQTLLSGTELGPALHSFTREFSDKRLSASRESIGRKTTYMTVVMILFMMPALMIVLAGPAVVAVRGALSSMAASK